MIYNRPASSVGRHVAVDSHGRLILADEHCVHAALTLSVEIVVLAAIMWFIMYRAFAALNCKQVNSYTVKQ